MLSQQQIESYKRLMDKAARGEKALDQLLRSLRDAKHTTMVPIELCILITENLREMTRKLQACREDILANQNHRSKMPKLTRIRPAKPRGAKNSRKQHGRPGLATQPPTWLYKYVNFNKLYKFI